jgi:putative oxidoreductase
MKAIRSSSILLARLFISLIFILSGLAKLLSWHETETLVLNVLCDWQAHLGFSQTAQECVTSMIGWAPVLAAAAALFELVGGLLLLFDIKARLGATLLVLVLIPATFLFHSFWFLEGPAKELQQIMFLKNLAILGGLLLVLVNGVSTSKKEGFSADSF